MDSDTVRADRWLWAARFYKTRRLAREACDGGKIELNGARCKPAKTIRIGDRLRINRAGERIELDVQALSDTRGPASVARALYQETANSQATREHERALRRLTPVVRPARRPDKNERRRLRRFKQGR